MFEREVSRYIEWVEENLPSLSMRDSSQIRRIVSLAVSETRAIRIVLSVLGGVLGMFVGRWALVYWIGDAVPESAHTVAVAICGIVVTYATAVASEVLVHRRIEYFADGT